MSRRVPSKRANGTKTAELTEMQDCWSKLLFKETSICGGQFVKAANWSVKIEHLGRRHTFCLGTLDKEAAAVEAKAIYESILAEGWEAALAMGEKEPTNFPKTDPRFWAEQLILRRYRFPASDDSEKCYAARISHAGSGYFFPLGSDDMAVAAKLACRIYCTIVKQGWGEAGNLFPRELIVAFEWSANPIMWTYTTVHTLVGRLAHIGDHMASPPTARHRVLIVESDAGLRRALAWCVNHQPGCCAVECESPEHYARAIAEQKPALVLLNRSLAEHVGINFSGGLTALPSGGLALAYSVSVDGDHMFVSTPGGAEGYMLKRVDPVNALEPMLQNGAFVGAVAEDCLAPVKLFFKRLLRPRSGQHAVALEKLSPRENEVLLLMSKGCVDKEIAQAMGISVWTVHGHIKKIFERLGVRTRTEAVVRYLEK